MKTAQEILIDIAGSGIPGTEITYATITQAMMVYTEQWREKAFDDGQKGFLTSNEMGDYWKAKYNTYEDYKKANPLK